MKESINLTKAGFRMFSTSEIKEDVFRRQAKIPGFSQKVLKSAVITLVGAGGLGGEYGEGLVRKGAGKIRILDADNVEPSNLNRQLFFSKDLFKNKAVSLAENLSKTGFGETMIIGYPYNFEEAVALGVDLSSSAAIVGVDNDKCRVHAAEYFIGKNIPVVFTGVSEDGNSGYVFIQESKDETPCFGCLYPDSAREVKEGSSRSPCPNTPAIKDILKIMGGLVIFAVDTLLMERKRSWNYRVFYLDGSVPSGESTIKQKPECLICGRKE